MKPVLVLDSTPLGLIVQRRDWGEAEKCRHWIRKVLASGTKVFVPEVVNYELRRELLRLCHIQCQPPVFIRPRRALGNALVVLYILRFSSFQAIFSAAEAQMPIDSG
ncbi:MAG TPA: hypothetical protein VG326_07600 [Tepidisphaeraceae bacterium]|jgi:hypothetical protein|nr:hypothetical protein [Tepidisphaeraceae bacterium]